MNDFTFNGTVTSSGPAITGAATATAFTTTYGTASTAQGFTIGGTGLTADITATAATGFEVANGAGAYGATATFTQSGGTVSGATLNVRLAATAAVGGTYNSQNIALTSTGATTVNITTASSGNSVTAKGLTITGLTGSNKTYNGNTTAAFTGTAAYSGLVNSQSFSVTGSPVANFTSAAAGNGKTINITGYAAPSANYTLTQPSLTANIDPAPLTITANNVTKVFGATLSSPVTGSTAFTSSGLVNSETIGSVTITYGTGAAAGDAAGTYTGQVTPSAATGGTFTAANYSITYAAGDITVSANPTITLTGPLADVSTTYGTATASPTSFTVSAGNLTGAPGNLTVAALSGFEYSTSSGGTYTSTLNIPYSSATLASTPVFVRLAAASAAATYSGNITVSGGGAPDQQIATVSSTVSPAPLTITGLTGVSKPYDGGTAATSTGTPTYSGLVNGESFSVSGSATAAFVTKTVGAGKPINITGYTAPSANYTLTQPTLTADITAIALTVTGASVTPKTYDNNNTATITGASLVGVISPDVVTIATSTGTFADVNAANGIAVTAALTLGGADAANYTLTLPVGLTGNITQASQTIIFNALSSKTTADAPFALTATASSGLTVSYSSGNTSVATVAGSTVTIVGAGTATITASQAGNGNYAAATSVPQTLTVTVPSVVLAGWDTSTQPGGSNNFGLSPFPASEANSDVTVGDLTRGSGVGTTGTAAGRAWGGVDWQSTSAAAAISASKFATFTIAPKAGKSVSFSSISQFDYRRSTSGPTSGVLQYSTDGTNFTDITTTPLSYSSTSSSGASLAPIDLSGIGALQNVPDSTTVTFRIANYGGTSTSGTWYIWDKANSTANDFEVSGSVMTVASTTGNFWVGDDATRGGDGTWTATGGTAWSTTDADNATVGGWDQNKTATFGGSVATSAVTVSSAISANNGMLFTQTGYTLSGGTSITLGGASATINTITTDANVAATISTPLLGSAGMTKAGTGTLTLTAANTYTGGTTVSDGALIVGNTPSSTASIDTVQVNGNNSTGTASSASQLRGTGTVGAVTLTNGTTVGDAVLWPGTASVVSALTPNSETLTATSANLSAGGKLAIVINNTNGKFQSLSTTGSVTLGGTSVLSLAFDTASNGNSYDIVNATGGISLPFNTVLGITGYVADATAHTSTSQVDIQYTDGTNVLYTNPTPGTALTGVTQVRVYFYAAVSPVKIADFTTRASDIGTTLSWKAVSEYQNAGYNIYRRELGAIEWVKINPALIAGRVTNPDEKTYSYFDFSPAGSFEYMLQSVSINNQIEIFEPQNNSVTIDWNTDLTSADEVSIESIDATQNYFSLTSSVTRAALPIQNVNAPAAVATTPATAVEATASREIASNRESISAASITTANIGVRWFSASSKIATNSYSAAKVQYKNPGVMLIPQSSMPAGFDLTHVTLQREGRNFKALALTPEGLLVHAPGYKDDYTDKDALFIRNTTSATAVSTPAASTDLFKSALPVNVTSTATVTNEYHDVYFDYNNALRPYNFAPWFSNKYLTQGTSQDFTIDLPQASSAAAKIVINLWSVTSSDTINPDHALQVQVNGQTLVSSNWDGGGSMRQITVDLKSGILNAGLNTVSLVTPNIDGLTSQIAFVHSIATTYTRALDGSKAFEIVNDSTTPRLYEMYNVPAAGVWIVDARFNDRSALVASESQIQKDGTLLVRFLAAPGGSGKFVITPIGQENQPLNISNRLVKALKLNGPYLATGPAQFATGTQPLLMKRSREGIRGMYVDQEQLFDFYNHGRYGPDGIRNAVRSTKPTYLLLVGRTTYDYLNYENQNIDPLCPAYLVSTSFWAQTTSDSLYGDLGRGFPEVAVGRLPVNNVAELSGAVSHIVSYKGVPSSGMRLHAVSDKPDALVADFGSQLDTVVKSNNPDVTWQENYYMRTYQTPAEVTTAMKAAANGGADIVLYAGHGNASYLGTSSPDLLDKTSVQDWTGNTVFLQCTCTANWMARNVPGYKSIAIQALTQTQGGISASIGTSTYMNPDVAATFMNQLLRNTAKPGSRWGQVLLKTQQWAGTRNSNSFYTDLMNTEQLFGDPAMPVFQQPSNTSSVNSAAGTF